MPEGPLKSGMPHAVDMPAPVNTTILLLCRTCISGQQWCAENSSKLQYDELPERHTHSDSLFTFCRTSAGASLISGSPSWPPKSSLYDSFVAYPADIAQEIQVNVPSS